MLFANIKGVPRATMVSTVSFMLKHMDLLQGTNRVAGSLSGGNKRKLSAAIAFLGDPPVIFLGASMQCCDCCCFHSHEIYDMSLQMSHPLAWYAWLSRLSCVDVIWFVLQDPVTRRRLWNTIAGITAKQTSAVILTTHSMEECEALCSRVGIMVDGGLKAVLHCACLTKYVVVCSSVFCYLLTVPWKRAAPESKVRLGFLSIVEAGPGDS